MTIFDILIFVVVVMFLLYFLKPELRVNRQFNYALAGVMGLFGILDFMIGLTFKDIIFLVFGAFWLFSAYHFYKKAQLL